jgi:RNA polymerase sigma factor (TIGR02999 family)
VGDITQLLDRWSHGDPDALKTLMPLVYDELHRLAGHYLRNERPGHTLQPTALVHEAYLRLSGLRQMPLNNRTHFYGASAEVMRRVLVDYARRKGAVKRQSDAAAEVPVAMLDTPIDLRLDLVALDRALEELAAFAPDKAKVVELRYFGGLSTDEIAEFLQVSPVTIKRHWRFARAWLLGRLTGATSDPQSKPLAPGSSTP